MKKAVLIDGFIVTYYSELLYSYWILPVLQQEVNKHDTQIM